MVISVLCWTQMSVNSQERPCMNIDGKDLALIWSIWVYNFQFGRGFRVWSPHEGRRKEKLTPFLFSAPLAPPVWSLCEEWRKDKLTFSPPVAQCFVQTRYTIWTKQVSRSFQIRSKSLIGMGKPSSLSSELNEQDRLWLLSHTLEPTGYMVFIVLLMSFLLLVEQSRQTILLLCGRITA